jgi:microsomal epoxide hydrolase
VVAVDPPGMGDSDRPPDGYDTGAVADRMRDLVDALGWQRFHLVVHDIGCWIGYPFAARQDGRVRKLVMVDAAVPGIIPSDAYAFQPERIHKNWHFAFNALPDLPETLIAGREREFLSWLFHAKTRNPAAIEPAALDEYVRCYAAPGGQRGGLGYYRAIFDDIQQNRAHATGKKLAMPVLAVGGADGLGVLMEQMMRNVADDVTGVVVPECGHYIPEEAPAFLAERVLAFLG